MSLKNKTLTILRAVPGQYIDGTYIESSERETITTKGNVQPNKPGFQSIVSNPQMLTTDYSGSKKIYSDDELFSVDTSPLKQADILVYRGKQYKVKTTSGLRQGITFSHYHSTAELITNGE